jgi:parallel beta-helix repeat protein
MVPGTNLRGSDAQGIFTRCSSEGGEFTVTYNNISYTCHNGIGGYYAEYNGTITHNFIDHAMQVTDDGGGIYFGATNDFQSTVAYNIILNTGVGNTAAVISRGIYMDTKSDNVIIDNNVVAYSKGAGIILHSGDDIIITNNLSYDNGYSATDRYASLLFLEDNTYSPSINVTTTNNKFIARTTSQITFYNTHSDAEILANGTFDYNYYARPIDDDEVFYYSGGFKTLAQWKTYTSQDVNSLSSPTAIDNDNQLHFIYNATQESTYWDLSAPMVDVTGADYSGQVALLPYTGLVLIGNGTVTEHVFTGGTTFAKDANGDFIKDTNGNFIKIINE